MRGANPATDGIQAVLNTTQMHAALWNSRFGAMIDGVTTDYFLLNPFVLGNTAGLGPKKTIDVFVDRAVGGNPFKAFGTWSKSS